MNSLRKVNQAEAALLNRRLVMHLLRESGPLSRRQLAVMTGLRSSSLTYIARDLMNRGVIRTSGKLDRAGAGKKQVLLEINPAFGWVLGVGVEGESASMVLLDARGRIIDRDRLALCEPFSLLPKLLKSRLDNWLARRGAPAGDLLGVGVGMTGVIDSREGVVLRSTRFKLENWPLCQEVGRVFGVPVRADNDSNFAALAESCQGNAADVDDFVYFLVNSHERGDRYAISSLGSALFVRGTLFRGAHYGAGEIDALLDGDHYDTVTAEQLLAIASPDAPFDEALRRVADRLISTLVVIVDLIDPAAVILGGNLSLTNRAMIQYIESQLHQRIVSLPRRRVSVRASRFMDHGVSMGAAIAALDQVSFVPRIESAGAPIEGIAL